MMVAVSITENPLARAKAVTNPAITQLLDLDAGEHLDAVQFITDHLYETLIEDRVQIVSRMVAGNPRFACGICHVPVYLVSRPEEHIFYFRHRHEDGSCPAQTRSLLTAAEICARKYHGLRESEPHKRIKELILRSLRADPAFRDIATEKNWRSATRERAFRRPDVQAQHEAGKLAFEVQLSTTFLSVVAGRREFYRDEGALLVWVLGAFNPAYRLLTVDDLLFSNNSNVFVVDEETASLSEHTGVFHLRCHYRQPLRQGDKLADRWEQEIVPFHSLAQDRTTQRTYLFDYASEKDAILAAIAADKAERTAALIRIDQQDLQEFWYEHGRHFRHTAENRATWEALRDRFALRGIELPLYPDTDQEFGAMLSTLYSVREGTPVVWKFNKLIQVAHLLAENHPQQLVAFGHALKIFDRAKLLSEQDAKGKWRTRIAQLSARMRSYDTELLPDVSLLPLMRFLFPEVAAKVEAYLKKAVGNSDDRSN